MEDAAVPRRNDDRDVTIPQAVREFGGSEQTYRRAIKQGRFPERRNELGHHLIAVSDITPEWLATVKARRAARWPQLSQGRETPAPVPQAVGEVEFLRSQLRARDEHIERLLRVIEALSVGRGVTT